MKKLTIILLSIVTLICNIVYADEGDKLKVNLELSYKNKYVAPNGSCLYPNPVIQGSFTLTHKDYPGWYINLWRSGSFSERYFNRENKFASEIDYTLGYSNDWFEGCISYWDCGDTFDKEGDILFSSFKLKRTFVLDSKQTLTPYIKLSNYYCLDNTMKGNGIGIYAGLSHNMPINEKMDLTSQAVLVWGDGALFTQPGGLVGKIGTSLGWQANAKVATSVDIDYYFPIGELKDGREEQVVLSFTVKF